MIKKVIYIGGVARSGTSWIGQIFNSVPIVNFKFQPLFSYEFRGSISEDSTSEEYQEFYKNLLETNTDFLVQRDKIKKGIYPKFQKKEPKILVFKENRFQSFIEPMLRKTDNLLFVGVIRNPNATLYSWSQNKKEFPPGSEILKEWRFANCKNSGNEDYFGYYKWKEVANMYLDLKEKYPERVQIIHYDKFLENTLEKVKALFQKLNIPFTEETINFLESSSKRNDDNYYSVYKSTTDRNNWKHNLPKHITTEIESDLTGTRLEKFLF